MSDYLLLHIKSVPLNVDILFDRSFSTFISYQHISLLFFIRMLEQITAFSSYVMDDVHLYSIRDLLEVIVNSIFDFP